MVLALGIVKGLRLYKEKIIRQMYVSKVQECVSDEDLRKCEIQVLVMGW